MTLNASRNHCRKAERNICPLTQNADISADTMPLDQMMEESERGTLACDFCVVDESALGAIMICPARFDNIVGWAFFRIDSPTSTDNDLLRFP